MAQCSICSDPRAREINRWLLTGRQVGVTAKEFGFNRDTLAIIVAPHIPYWSRNRKVETVREQIQELKYEVSRLAVLAECGEKVGKAISALTVSGWCWSWKRGLRASWIRCTKS